MLYFNQQLPKNYKSGDEKMNIIGDENKSTFLRVFKNGRSTNTYIEYHQYKNDLDAIKKTGADKVALYVRHSGGAFTTMYFQQPETTRKVADINLVLLRRT